jgi:hypothetical protein
MKKILLSFIMTVMCAISANAQFEEGRIYTGASLTGLNLSYNGKDNLNLGLQGQVGYMFYDNLMVLGQASFQHSGNDNVADQLTVGVGGRYYIVQNGLYLGVNAKLLHANHNYNDLMPGIEIGYAFFISHTATIEPAIYYDQSFRNHSDYSTIGFRIGFGLYL